METVDPENILTITYNFTFTTGEKKTVAVRIDKETTDTILDAKACYPPWASLAFNQCPNCPLTPDKHPYCPAAMSIADTVETFRVRISSDNIVLLIETPERTYTKTTTIQNGVSSLMGLQMATSACPFFSKLKPMARFHLPFASSNETKYRVLSMHFLAQYFMDRRGQKVGWDLKKLTEVYTSINTANNSFSKRLYDTTTKDANINALIKLDTFASTLTYLMDEETLNEMETWFKAYIS